MLVSDLLMELSGQARDELRRVKDLGAAQLVAGRFSEAEEVIQRARQLDLLLGKLDEIERLWLDLMPDRSLPPDSASPVALPETPEPELTPPSIAENRRTPEEEYVLPLLRALVDMEGRAAAALVVDRVGEAMARVLTDFDRQPLQSGDPRWRNTAHWTRSQLVQRGMLSKTSPRGIWEITPQGQKYLEEKQVRRE